MTPGEAAQGAIQRHELRFIESDGYSKRWTCWGCLEPGHWYRDEQQARDSHSRHQQLKLREAKR
jgi:hypothetical protein